MDTPLRALRASVDRLHNLVSGLDDADLSAQSYCNDWSVAQVLSHLGSGAVIGRRAVEDAVAGSTTPEGFNQSVWDEWDAKAPRAQADDALAADAALLQAYELVGEAERARLSFPLGPLSLGFDDFVGLRLNEHTFHAWDIAVTFDDAALLPEDATELVVDNLALIARFSGRPGGLDRTVTIRTITPDREVALALSAGGVALTTDEGGSGTGPEPELELPAEALCRLVYGRLDPAHTPGFTGDAALVATLREVFPGP
jgi:uncharacterized protein (TIGR03083 family)